MDITESSVGNPLNILTKGHVKPLKRKSLARETKLEKLNSQTARRNDSDSEPEVMEVDATPANTTNALYNSCPKKSTGDTDKAGILGSFQERQPILIVGTTSCGKTSWILNIIAQHMFDELFDFAHICCQSVDHPAYKAISDKIHDDQGKCEVRHGISETLFSQYMTKEYDDKHFLFVFDDLDQNFSVKENKAIIGILSTAVNVFHSKINSLVIITTHDPFTTGWAGIKKGCKVYVLFFSNENASSLRRLLQVLYLQNPNLVNSIMSHMENDIESSSPGIIIKNSPRDLESKFFTLDGVKLVFPTK